MWEEDFNFLPLLEKGDRVIYVFISEKLLAHLPDTTESISHGSMNKLINICVTIGARILRFPIIYKTASNALNTVVAIITGSATFNSPLKRTHAP